MLTGKVQAGGRRSGSRHIRSGGGESKLCLKNSMFLAEDKIGPLVLHLDSMDVQLILINL